MFKSDIRYIPENQTIRIKAVNLKYPGCKECTHIFTNNDVYEDITEKIDIMIELL
jgi:hypothetical protein